MTAQPFSLRRALAEARQSIEACVVFGGTLFSDADVLAAIASAAGRGVVVRSLFPSPRSRWLHVFATDRGQRPAEYNRIVGHQRLRVAEALPSAEVRWYDAPGPCWFTLIDRTVLYTKPFGIRRALPVAESRSDYIAHFGVTFDQLWERSLEDFRQMHVHCATSPIIKVVSITRDIIARLGAHPEELSTLSPNAFELLVADRLAAMGLCVRRVGTAESRDGGIDMIAWPERNSAVPFLLAVQAKHSRHARAVPPSVVRDLKGVLSAAPVDIGLLVTNTSFSPDARWAAMQGPRIVRLRDFNDLVRWLRADFANETLYRDIPGEIALAPGLKIAFRGGDAEGRDRT